MTQRNFIITHQINELFLSYINYILNAYKTYLYESIFASYKYCPHYEF